MAGELPPEPPAVVDLGTPMQARWAGPAAGARLPCFRLLPGLLLPDLRRLEELNAPKRHESKVLSGGRHPASALATGPASHAQGNTGYGGLLSLEGKLPQPARVACKFFLQGRCRFSAERCPNSHEPGAEKPTNLNSTPECGRAWKNQLCIFWAWDCCKKGDECTFAHGVDDLRCEMSPESEEILQQRWQTEHRKSGKGRSRGGGGGGWNDGGSNAVPCPGG
ncbi:unnamed protein product, partial [Prorocentrum cordatum]